MDLRISTVSPTYHLIDYDGRYYYYKDGEISTGSTIGRLRTSIYIPEKYPEVLIKFLSHITGDPHTGKMRELKEDVKMIVSYHEESDSVTTYSMKQGYQIYTMDELDLHSYQLTSDELIRHIYENPDKILQL